MFTGSPLDVLTHTIQNILIDKNNKIMVIDVGNATIHPDGFVPYLLGADAFAPPELRVPNMREIQREIEYDGRKADVWAIGLILEMMFHGKTSAMPTKKYVKFLERLQEPLPGNRTTINEALVLFEELFPNLI